jgi:hypothetical protein
MDVVEDGVDGKASEEHEQPRARQVVEERKKRRYNNVVGTVVRGCSR